MKILVIAFSKIKYAPYINFYLENLDIQQNEVHLLYWNRDLKEEDTSKFSGVVLHEFRCYQEDEVSPIKKMGSFLKFRHYAKALLQKENFDFLVVLTSLPAVLLYDILSRKYCGRYLFDYRDSSYERFSWFQKRIHGLVYNSYSTFVSSDGFREYLPEDAKEKICTAHNILADSLAHRDERVQFGTKSSRIRLVAWGLLRCEEMNRTVITKVAEDPRFELHYHGREQQIALRLKEYAKTIGANNVFFHGEYRPEERYEFVRSTDILHNIYDGGNEMKAMGNKYYDGTIFRLPQLCFPGSFMGKLCERAGIGKTVDPASRDFLDTVYDYYITLDWDSFRAACDRETERVVREYKEGCRLIRQATGERASVVGNAEEQR